MTFEFKRQIAYKVYGLLEHNCYNMQGQEVECATECLSKLLDPQNKEIDAIRNMMWNLQPLPEDKFKTPNFLTCVVQALGYLTIDSNLESEMYTHVYLL